MKALVVHNRYSSRVPSGENLAVDDEVRWLEDAGVEVHRYETSNDELLDPSLPRRLRQGAEAFWSSSARRRFLELVDAVAPDVVHLHNLFPLLTASVPSTALQRGVPVVWTAHNKRLLCVQGGNYRADAPCYQCRPGWRLPGIVHGCYANSPIASSLVTASTSVFRAVVRLRITAVAISEDMRGWLTSTAGFEPTSVHVKANGVADAALEPPVATSQREIVFLGRLTPNKGIELLLDAWARAGQMDATLRVVGDGPLASAVQAAAECNRRITWAGLVPASETSRYLSDARAVVVPSTWDEPFGRVAAEAFAHGRPVITTGQGALSEIVDETTGWVTGTDPDAMAAALRAATRRDAGGDAAVAQRGAAARARYDERYSPEATTRRLIEIYESAIAGAAGTAATTAGSPRRR